MNNTQDNKDVANRSVAEFSVQYSVGLHTQGKKKGQEKIEEETITIIVLSDDEEKVRQHIDDYCNKKNIQLMNFVITPLPGKRAFEFNCQRCGELSINADPKSQKTCSEYCRKKLAI